MNIIDAVKSGRTIRRGPGGSWLNPDFCSPFTKLDVLANDWEISEPEVRITRQQFYEAFGEEHRKRQGEFMGSAFARDLAKRLGLEP